MMALQLAACIIQPVGKKEWKENGSKRGKTENKKREGRADLGDVTLQLSYIKQEARVCPCQIHALLMLPTSSCPTLPSQLGPDSLTFFLFLEHLPLSQVSFFTHTVPFVWTPSSLSATIWTGLHPSSTCLLSLKYHFWKAFPEPSL